VEWEVEYTDQFEAWWDGLTAEEQDSIAVGVGLLRAHGAALRRPHSGSIRGSAYPNMRELVVQHAGHPYRVLYAFDPRRVAILLIGGDKTGDDRWYDVNVPLADRLYEEHLETLKREEHRRGAE
jgi:hypothetical protein